MNKGEGNTPRFFTSRAGSKIIFDDTEGEEKLQIISSDGSTRLEICFEDKEISLKTDDDITISSDGEICVNSEKAAAKTTNETLTTITSGTVIHGNKNNNNETPS